MNCIINRVNCGRNLIESFETKSCNNKLREPGSITERSLHKSITRFFGAQNTVADKFSDLSSPNTVFDISELF